MHYVLSIQGECFRLSVYQKTLEKKKGLFHYIISVQHCSTLPPSVTFCATISAGSFESFNLCTPPGTWLRVTVKKTQCQKIAEAISQLVGSYCIIIFPHSNFLSPIITNARTKNRWPDLKCAHDCSFIFKHDLNTRASTTKADINEGRHTMQIQL